MAALTLSLGPLLAGCATTVPLETYKPLYIKPLPQAAEVLICVQSFEDLTKNGFTDKRWVGSRYNILGLLAHDYELQKGSIAEAVTQAAVGELTAQGFRVTPERAPQLMDYVGSGDAKFNEDCHFIVKGSIKKFWCKVFYEVTTEVVIEAELIDADTGKTLWTKQEMKKTSMESSEILMTSQQEPQWVAENLRSGRDYVIRKLFRDERFLRLLTKKAAKKNF